MEEKKLFVVGFPYAFTEQELGDAFSVAGTVVSTKIIMEKETGRSRGFGFVEMSTKDEAQAAIDHLNGTNLGGRMINVNIAKPLGGRSGGRSDRSRDRDDRSDRRDYTR